MAASAGIGLKFLQWFIRGIQFLSAALILGVYSYFLATLHNHDLPIATQVRAVEGISGVAVLYALAGLLLLCCFAGLTFTSLIAIVLDVAFIGAFIYVASANKNGAGSCKGYVDTPFGKGKSQDAAKGEKNGFTELPSFHTACKLQTACFAVSIIAIFFFVFSILTEVALARHHRKEKRFGPGPQNNYTSGYGNATPGGFFGRLFGRKNKGATDEDNMLPQHPTPGQVYGDRMSYATDTTAVQRDGSRTYGYNPVVGHDPAKVEHGYGNQMSGVGQDQYGSQLHDSHAPPTAQPYRYDDGIYDEPAGRRVA